MATAAQYARDGPGTAAKREALLAYYDELAAVGRSLERCVHNVVEGLTEDGADDRGVTPGTRKVGFVARRGPQRFYESVPKPSRR